VADPAGGSVEEGEVAHASITWIVRALVGSWRIRPA
jgi:hypothetical protein